MPKMIKIGVRFLLCGMSLSRGSWAS